VDNVGGDVERGLGRYRVAETTGGTREGTGRGARFPTRATEPNPGPSILPWFDDCDDKGVLGVLDAVATMLKFVLAVPVVVCPVDR